MFYSLSEHFKNHPLGSGLKESPLLWFCLQGLAPPALWDLAADKQAMQSEQPLQVSSSNLVFDPFKKGRIRIGF